MRLPTLILLLLQCSSGLSISSSLHINMTASPVEILEPGGLFGSFFEDFLHAADGGIYAERLSNRAFAVPLNSSNTMSNQGWKAERGSVIWDTSHPLNKAVPNAAWLKPTEAVELGSPYEAVLSNSGFPGGIAVEEGLAFQLSLWIYVPSEDDISLTGELYDGNSTLAEVNLLKSSLTEASHAADPTTAVVPTPAAAKGGQWRQILAKLTPTSTAKGCRFRLRARSSKATGEGIGVTVVSLFPGRTWRDRHNGLRYDVAALLNESQPAFIRLPGGCYVEGTKLVNGWYWKKTIGPIESRPGHNNDVWQYWTDDGLGMYEVLTMATDVGAKPLLVVNAGCSTDECISTDADLAPFLQDALDAVEFATGSATSEWGAKRAAAGRTEPFELQALGIGNENCAHPDVTAYAQNYLKIAKAVKARYPNLDLVIGCETLDGLKNMIQLQPAIVNVTDLYDIHQRKTPAEFLAAAHEFDGYPRQQGYPKVFVSEYSSPRSLFPNSTTLRAAVAEAIYMAGMEANADVVKLATYGDLIANSEDSYDSSGISTIIVNGESSFGSPSWVVQKIFMHHQPASLVPSLLQIPGNPDACQAWPNGGSCDLSSSQIVSTGDDTAMLAGSVSLSKEGELQIKLINYGNQTVQVKVKVQTGSALKTKGRLDYATGTDPEAVNSFDDPRRVTILQKSLQMDAGVVNIELSAFSVSVANFPIPKRS